MERKRANLSKTPYTPFHFDFLSGAGFCLDFLCVYETETERERERERVETKISRPPRAPGRSDLSI